MSISECSKDAVGIQVTCGVNLDKRKKALDTLFRMFTQQQSLFHVLYILFILLESIFTNSIRYHRQVHIITGRGYIQHKNISYLKKSLIINLMYGPKCCST